MKPVFDPERDDGRLSLSQRFGLVLAAMNARWRRRRQAVPRHEASVHGNLPWSSLRAPKDALSTRAWALAVRDQEPWLVNHGLRCYAWARALSLIADSHPDLPMLFSACLLHDAGLTAAAAQPATHCFAVRSARYARRELADLASPEALECIGQAIVRHLDLRVDPQEGLEAHWLQAGAAMDVLGQGLGRLPSDLRQQVLGTYPRLGMKHALCQCMRAQASTSPHSRIGLYMRRFQFETLIQQADFED